MYEYLPACYERLAWATGFTGSAGAAFVFLDSAIVFVDGRYTLQVKQQLAPGLFTVGDLVDPGAFGWHLSNEDRPAKLRASLSASYIPNAAVPMIPSLVAIVMGCAYGNATLPVVLMIVVDALLIGYFLALYFRNRLDL